LILLDTNIFLEFLLGRKRSEDCGELLDALSGGRLEGVVTRFSLHAIEAVYAGDLLPRFLGNIDRSLGLTVYDTSTAEEVEAATLGGEIGRDFDDALQYHVARKLRVESIVSFDRHFDGLDVPRAEPEEVLHPSEGGVK
jgi:predicted nucleic acid-binding protein